MGVPVGAVTSVPEPNKINSNGQASQFGSAQIGDVNQFLSQLNGGGGAGKTAGTQQASGDNMQANLYDKILAPLGEFRSNFDQILNNIGGIVNKGQIGMADLFQIQFQLTQLSYMNDLTAKTADKISQGMQTLFRNQG
ncbi:MAG: hypothetical protein LBS68_03525 [Puniceicoccales bacterium]|jgi:hypothetical protein|nr:hypothetical protein [Puniceicoccales bacterium]